MLHPKINSMGSVNGTRKKWKHSMASIRGRRVQLSPHAQVPARIRGAGARIAAQASGIGTAVEWHRPGRSGHASLPSISGEASSAYAGRSSFWRKSSEPYRQAGRACAARITIECSIPNQVACLADVGCRSSQSRRRICATCWDVSIEPFTSQELKDAVPRVPRWNRSSFEPGSV